jgi:hypothetical protein
MIELRSASFVTGVSPARGARNPAASAACLPTRRPGSDLFEGFALDRRRSISVATTKQRQAAKRNVKKARQAATRKRTIANLPSSTRRELGKQAARGRQRGGRPGRALEDRNREQLYEIAKKEDIPGRSRMGKWDLIKAIRKRR